MLWPLMFSSTMSTLAFGGPAGAATAAEELTRPQTAPTSQTEKLKTRIQTKPRPPAMRTPSVLVGGESISKLAPNVRVTNQETSTSADDIMVLDNKKARPPGAPPKTLLSSSMAEHPAVNRRVVGSSPT